MSYKAGIRSTIDANGFIMVEKSGGTSASEARNRSIPRKKPLVRGSFHSRNRQTVKTDTVFQSTLTPAFSPSARVLHNKKNTKKIRKLTRQAGRRKNDIIQEKNEEVKLCLPGQKSKKRRTAPRDEVAEKDGDHKWTAETFDKT